MQQSLLFSAARNLWIALVFILHLSTKAQVLKSIVYDLDGLDIGATDLPEGDYHSGDLTYQVNASPLSFNDMIADRVLQVNLNWSSGMGVFGRGISRYIEFDVNADRINFFFYNPASNNQEANINVVLTDDDDQSNHYDYFSDDCWMKNITIKSADYWQFISIPFTDFYDSNPGGNGVFDIAYTDNKGMLLMTEFQFLRPAGAGNATFYLDYINFSDGALPHGGSEFDLPPKDPWDHSPLGAYMKQARGQEYLTASQFESLFPSAPGKKIRYVNYFLDWSVDGGTTANDLPGYEVQAMLSSGYRPVITWEPLFAGHDRLDPVQPRLPAIANGTYNSYIDAFANKIKSYDDTVIIRFMHEFEGNWYPWSLCYNNQDPNLYVSAFRNVVDRFRAAGANKVKWMWCLNSDCAPYAYYNFVPPAYPGDSYVDIVATDIYNNHYPVNLPYWKSFRMQCAESYYYLTKYFPQKPLYICEVGCRERFSWENPASQSKGDWYERMDKEMQSNFHKAQALIFFNAAPDQNWTVNSSPGALQSLIDNVWNDDYYFSNFNSIAMRSNETDELHVFPNPTTGTVTLKYRSASMKDLYRIRIHNAIGQVIYTEEIKGGAGIFKQIDFNPYPKGVYFVELISNTDPDKGLHKTKKLVYQ